MPRTSEASATSRIVINRLPPAQLVIIREKVLPIPAVDITLTMIPTATSNTATVVVFLAPIANASRIALGPIRCGDNQDATTTDTMLMPAA